AVQTMRSHPESPYSAYFSLLPIGSLIAANAAGASLAPPAPAGAKPLIAAASRAVVVAGETARLSAPAAHPVVPSAAAASEVRTTTVAAERAAMTAAQAAARPVRPPVPPPAPASA